MSDIAQFGFSVDTNGLKKGKKGLKEFSKEGQKTEKSLSKVSSGISSSFASIAGSIGLVATAMLGLNKVVSISREFDVLNAQLITATGSSQKAAKAFQGIQKFAAETPFDLAQVTNSFVKLKNLGLDPSERALTSYGNTASAMGKDMNQLIEAVADATTNEFERLKEFGIKTKQEGDNVSFTFRGITKTVKKDSDAIQGYLIALGENEFAGAMAQRVNTLDGAISNLGDGWDKLFLNISQAGIGGLMEDSVRLGISALDEMNSFLESGEFAASLDLVFMKFSVLTDPLEDGIEDVTNLLLKSTSVWSEDIDEFGKHFDINFKNIPENIKAIFQLVGIEIGSISAFAKEHGAAFGDIMGVNFAQFIKATKIKMGTFSDILGSEFAGIAAKAGAMGKKMKSALNPFTDDFDILAEFAKIEAFTNGVTDDIIENEKKQLRSAKDLATEMSDEILKNATDNAEKNTEIKRDAIEWVFIERDASIASTDAQILKIKELRAEFDKIKKARAESTEDSLAEFGSKGGGDSGPSKKQRQELEKLTKQVDNFGGAWSKSGSIIIDAFGDISDSLNDYMDRMGDIAKLEKDLADQRKNFKKDDARIISAEKKLNEEKVSAELAGLSSLASAGQSLFDEKTAAAKSFAALQKIITVAEIALSFQKMAASNAETITTVGNETTKASASGTSAIAAAFAAPWPVGFIAGAAMIGIIGSLLGDTFGGGAGVDPTQSRQDTQGTGTVLGSDDKSSSITNSQERFEDIQIDQLAELRGIQSSLMAIEDGISIAVRDLVTGGLGEFSGDLGGSGSSGLGLGSIGALFSKTKRTVIDSGIQFVAQSLGDILSGGIVEASQFFDILKTKKRLFGLIKSQSTTTEFEALDNSFGESIGSIFQNIGSAVLDAASVLGFETVDRLVETVTRGIFVGGEAGTVFDGAFLPIANELGTMLGTSFETVTMTLEEALAEFTVDIGQVSLEGLTNEEIEAELQAIFSQQADLIAEFLVPSIKEYQQVGEGLFDTLLRVAKEQVVFIDQIEKMGFSLSGLSNLIQIDVAQSIIQLTGGLENFTDLTQSFFENFFSDAEQMAALENSLEDSFASLGLAMIDSRDEFKELVQGIDLTTQEGQELFAALMAINPALDEYIDRLGDARDLLIDSANDAFSMLERSVAIERERANVILEAAELAHNAELERLNGLREELEAEHDLRLDNLATAQSALDSAFNAEMARINETANARIASLDSEKIAITATANAMKTLVGTINKSLGLDGSSDLIGALADARAGDFSKAQKLDVNKLANLDPKNFASASALAIQQAINKGRLSTIGGLAGSKLSESESLLLSIAAQTESVRASSAAEIAALENQRNNILGIETGVLSIADAVAQFQEAQASLDSLNYEAEIAKLDMLVESANSVFALHEKAYADELARLDEILIDNENLLNAALGIDTSVKSVAEAIQFLNQTIIALNAPREIPIKDTGPQIHPRNPDFEDENRTPDIIETEILENRVLLKELVRTSRTSANALQQFALNGMDTRIVE